MSKRFGRNQRRRAREEAQRLTQQGITLSLALADAARTAVELRRALNRERAALALRTTQIEALQQELGPTLLLPPPDVIIDSREFRDLAESGRMQMREVESYGERQRIFEPSAFASNCAMDRYTVMTLDVIEAGIEVLKGSPNYRSPHAYVKTKAGAVMYAVRLEDLAQLHRPEGIHRIAHLLATEFIDTIKRQFPRR